MGARPTTTLDERYSTKGATETDWAEARSRLEDAEIFWISTVRPDGRPHVTPLIALLVDDTLVFSTGPDERKARNLAENAHCVLTTGRNAIGEGLDIVVEGDAVRITDDEKLRRIAELHVSKYGEEWRYEVRDGTFRHSGGDQVALVFEVAARQAFGFRNGDEFSQTRWSF